MAQIVSGFEFSTTVTFADIAVTDTVRVFAWDEEGRMFLVSEWPEPSWKNILERVRSSS